MLSRANERYFYFVKCQTFWKEFVAGDRGTSVKGGGG